MLSKPAAIILGVIYKNPLNAYELIKNLQLMNVKQWYDIANSTVYATIKSLGEKSYLTGEIQKDGNMPEKTVYSITDFGTRELKTTLKYFIEMFNYDLTYFMVAAFFLDLFEPVEALEILQNRLDSLNKINDGIEFKLEEMQKQKLPPHIIYNVIHSRLIIQSEIDIANKFIGVIQE